MVILAKLAAKRGGVQIAQAKARTLVLAQRQCCRCVILTEVTMEQPIEANLGNKTFTRGVDTASDSIHKAIDSASGAATPALEQVTAGAHSAVDQMAGGTSQ